MHGNRENNLVFPRQVHMHTFASSSSLLLASDMTPRKSFTFPITAVNEGSSAPNSGEKHIYSREMFSKM